MIVVLTDDEARALVTLLTIDLSALNAMDRKHARAVLSKIRYEQSLDSELLAWRKRNNR